MYNESIPVIAGADLSGSQYHAVGINGTIVATGADAVGLLQNKPKSGEDATLAFWGRSRYRAAAGVTRGAQLTVTTGGWLTTATSGSTVVGKALDTVSSGSIGVGIFNFAGNGATVA